MAVIDQDPKVSEYLTGIGIREAMLAGIQRITRHYQENGYSL
jgi:hypothetical protein